MKGIFKESAHMFGENNCLMGVMTEPRQDFKINEDIGIIFLNAGLLHHVGPNRLWVDLSRKFAKRGVVSLRFDLSGFGDSNSRKSGQSYEERSIFDITEAMDFLVLKKKLKRFVLLGFCSGAENAHRVALIDDRVGGVVFMDGYAYRTWKFYINRFWIIISDPVKIIMFIIQKFATLKMLFFRITKTKDDRRQIFSSDLPQRNKTVKELQIMIDRNIALLFLYTKGVYRSYNYKKQFEEMYKELQFNGMVGYHFFEKTDHMYTLLKDRKQLQDNILQWYQRIKNSDEG